MPSRVFWKLFIPFGILCVALVLGVTWVIESDWEVVPFSLLFLFGSFLVTWRVVSSVLKPVAMLSESASRMSRGEYETPIYLGTQDELGQLAASFNSIRHDMIAKTAEMNRLSMVLAAMTDGVIAVDQNQHVQFANVSAGRMLEFSPHDAQGRPLLELVRSHKLHELVTRLMASKGHDEIEMEWGDEQPQSLFVSATYFSDVPSAGIIMMINNLSEIRHLQAMRRDFVANVSHELKTPLSSIKAYAETLSEGALNDPENRGRFVKIIEEQADRLNQLISDLLSLARIEQGNTLMEIGLVPLERIVNSCVLEQERAAEKKDIELLTKPSGREITVKADEDGLRQILVNLIDNAIKYTPTGGTVTVGWEQFSEDIQIYVADTGLGIPGELQERVFERFFRVDKARSRELGGTGLGLAIVKHLSQSFGGTVEVAGEPEGGSRFTVKLPLPS